MRWTYLEDETGRPRVKEFLRCAESGTHELYLSLINLGEVPYIAERERGLLAAQRALAAVDQLPLRIVPCSRAIVIAAAHNKACHCISYADVSAVVTARDDECILLTGDPEFRPVVAGSLIALEWLPG